MKNCGKAKILFLPLWYPNKNNPIAGSFVRRHAESIKDIYNVTILHICEDVNSKRIFSSEILNEKGFNGYRIYYKHYRYLFPLNILLFYLAFIYAFIKFHKKIFPVDFVHVHVLTRVGIVALVLNKIFNIQYFISEHWSRYTPERNSYKGFLRKIITKIIVENSKGISAVSQNLKKSINNHQLIHKNFPIINNTIDFESFTPNNLIVNTNNFTFLHVSGMEDKVKNITGILKAIVELSKMTSDFTFNFVGHSFELNKYQNFINKNNLKKNVIILGELLGKELIYQYQNSDCFVIYSFFENQPCVVIESFACGLPVIVSNNGGMPELINDGNGLIVKSNEPVLLALAMYKIMNSRNNYDSNLIRENAIRKYSATAVSKQIVDFYNG